MRRMTITGHIAADPETKMTKGGKEFIKFRIGNNEIADKDENGNKITFWSNVTVWDPTLMAFCKYLKKGSAVCITGDYYNSLYTSKVSGGVEISNDITARIIDFWGAKTDNENNQAAAPVAATEPAKPVASVKPAAKTVAPAATAQMGDEGNDDLPF